VQIVLLIVALSADVFLASVACGAENIKIETKTALCISGICSGVLFFALTAGKLLDGIIKKEYTAWLSFAVFFMIGIFKLTEYGVKAYIRKYKFLCKRVKISFAQLNFILDIYNNPVMADKDRSAVMSVAEGAFFALAMSFDGFFGGLGAAFLKINVWQVMLLNFILSFAAVQVGCLAGKKAALRQDMDLSWIGGVMFLLLAAAKLRQ
jgi:putative sporulation protein YtaF